MVAVITAGGKGTRLSSIAVNVPKPMVKIKNKPILQYQIECLKNNGIFDIYIIIGYLGQVIKDYFKDGKSFGVNIKYVEEKEPLGTAGAFYYLKDKIKDDFIFVYGDLIFDVDFQQMVYFHNLNNAMITLLSHPNSHPFDSDLIIANNNCLVTSIDSKHNIRNYYYRNLVNSGIYIVSNKIFDNYFKSLLKIDFEKDVLIHEICNKDVYSYRSTEYVKDIGTKERYFSTSFDIENGITESRNLKKPQKCIFLDRDGTINKYIGFANDINKIELEDFVDDGLKIINKSGYLAIVITNQPVVARGDITLDELNLIHAKIETLLGEKGCYFDDLFFCPHHPDKGFEGEVPELKIECNCRKPNIGMLLKAKEKYNIDLSKSFFVGDTTIDMQTAKNAGVKSILVNTGLKGSDNKFEVKPDFKIDNLKDINKIIGD